MASATARVERDREFSFHDKEFNVLRDIVRSQTGIALGDHKKEMVYGRLARRLRALGLTSFTQYCDLIGSNNGDEELSMLVNAITTNLTKFFREDHHSSICHSIFAPWSVIRRGERKATASESGRLAALQVKSPTRSP